MILGRALNDIIKTEKPRFLLPIINPTKINPKKCYKFDNKNILISLAFESVTGWFDLLDWTQFIQLLTWHYLTVMTVRALLQTKEYWSMYQTGCEL